MEIREDPESVSPVAKIRAMESFIILSRPLLSSVGKVFFNRDYAMVDVPRTSWRTSYLTYDLGLKLVSCSFPS